MSEQLTAAVLAMLASHFERFERPISGATQIVEELRADSLDMLELLIMVEERYGVIITDAEAAAFVTVGDACDCIAEKLGGSEASDPRPRSI